jgi:hypothetical protein
MTKTIQDLAQEALEILGILAADEQPDTADFAKVDRSYRAKYAEWALDERTYWPVLDIPDELIIHIARVVADDIALAFGKSAPVEMDTNGQQVTCGLRGLRGMQRVMSMRPSGLPVKACYF